MSEQQTTTAAMFEVGRTYPMRGGGTREVVEIAEGGGFWVDCGGFLGRSYRRADGRMFRDGESALDLMLPVIPDAPKPIFEAGQTYPTRGGEQALIYVTDAPGEEPIHGRVGSKCTSWRADGSWRDRGLSPRDLMPPAPERHASRSYANLRPRGGVTFWNSPDGAKAVASDCDLRIAVPVLVVEIVPGEPLATFLTRMEAVYRTLDLGGAA